MYIEFLEQKLLSLNSNAVRNLIEYREKKPKRLFNWTNLTLLTSKALPDANL